MIGCLWFGNLKGNMIYFRQGKNTQTSDNDKTSNATQCQHYEMSTYHVFLNFFLISKQNCCHVCLFNCANKSNKNRITIKGEKGFPLKKSFRVNC
jgi:hypothetical protein